MNKVEIGVSVKDGLLKNIPESAGLRGTKWVNRNDAEQYIIFSENGHSYIIGSKDNTTTFDIYTYGVSNDGIHIIGIFSAVMYINGNTLTFNNGHTTFLRQK